jgi:putative membrane protein
VGPYGRLANRFRLHDRPVFRSHAGHDGVKPAHFPEAPRYFGLALIFCGVAALLISVWQYRWTLRYLWSGNFSAVAGMKEEGGQTPLIAVCIALILIGLSAFFAVLFRLV